MYPNMIRVISIYVNGIWHCPMKVYYCKGVSFYWEFFASFFCTVTHVINKDLLCTVLNVGKEYESCSWIVIVLVVSNRLFSFTCLIKSVDILRITSHAKLKLLHLTVRYILIHSGVGPNLNSIYLKKSKTLSGST